MSNHYFLQDLTEEMYYLICLCGSIVFRPWWKQFCLLI